MPLERFLPGGGVTWPNQKTQSGQSSPPDLHSLIGKSVGIFSPFQMSHVISKQAINLAAGAKGVQALGRMERVCLLGALGGRKHEADGP